MQSKNVLPSSAMVHVGDCEKNVHDSLVIVEHVITDPNFLLSQPRFFGFSSFTVIVVYRWYDYWYGYSVQWRARLIAGNITW